ncbi:hypothetical protein JB92DRAFT_3110554 [Gautieria morchelliformis]|nr:hypothetical protein JB92DRAFT_3110554 [Gautieria morchelliformis]
MLLALDHHLHSSLVLPRSLYLYAPVVPFPSILTHVVGSLGEEFKSLIRPYILNGLIKGIPSLFVDVHALYGEERKGESIDDGILTPQSRLLSFPDILIHNCITVCCLQLNPWPLNNRLDPALALPIELIPSPSLMDDWLDPALPLILGRPTQSHSHSLPRLTSLNSPLDPFSFFPLNSYPAPHAWTTDPIPPSFFTQLLIIEQPTQPALTLPIELIPSPSSLNDPPNPPLILPIEVIPSPSSLNSPLNPPSSHRTHTQPLIFKQPTRSCSRSSH